MDIRCGGDGAVLNGRTLLAAFVVKAEYEECTSFVAAQEFSPSCVKIHYFQNIQFMGATIGIMPMGIAHKQRF